MNPATKTGRAGEDDRDGIWGMIALKLDSRERELFNHAVARMQAASMLLGQCEGLGHQSGIEMQTGLLRRYVDSIPLMEA
jgi:hypothetical protein